MTIEQSNLIVDILGTLLIPLLLSLTTLGLRSTNDCVLAAFAIPKCRLCLPNTNSMKRS